MKAKSLTPRQALFAGEYLKDLNATQAAKRAGYSARNADKIGPELLGKTRVASAIRAGQLERSKRTEITADAVVTEIAKLGFANMADYMRPNAAGDPVLHFEDLTRDQAAALQEVTVDTYTEGGGEDVLYVKRVKFKLADKLAALNSLGRHLGIFNDTLEVKGKLTLEDLVNASFRKGGPGGS